MDIDLTAKTALVTGSTRGIGLATAIGLAQMGAEVIVNGRDKTAVGEAVAKVQQAAPSAKVHAAVFDLGDAAGCAALVKQFPDVDILVNNLGIYEPKGFFDIEDADWTRMFEVNVMSGVRLTRHYLKRMLDNKDWGRVVFVSSESGVYIPKEMVHYGFSKSAQLVIARGAAETTKGTNVTVNSVMPGPTWVEMAPVRLAARAEAAGTTVDDLVQRTFTERRPASLLQRYAKPEGARPHPVGVRPHPEEARSAVSKDEWHRRGPHGSRRRFAAPHHEGLESAKNAKRLLR
jgi:NAD(P)-dependent dehydrogenase (short-subunit alcohol dehydrogenase family)